MALALLQDRRYRDYRTLAARREALKNVTP